MLHASFKLDLICLRYKYKSPMFTENLKPTHTPDELWMYLQTISNNDVFGIYSIVERISSGFVGT